MFLRYHDKRFNPHIKGIAVRERTKTINQGRTRAAALRRAASRKPLKLISSHSIFSDLTCSRVTSNQSRNPRSRSTRACTRGRPFPPFARGPEFGDTPDSISVILFVYNALLLTVRWSLTDRIPVTLARGTIGGIGAQRAVTHTVDPR